MNKKQFEEDWYKNLIGKTVFFMSEDKITKGVITKGDPYQLFVGKTHSIPDRKDFFFSIKELIESLKESVQNIT